MSPIDPAGIAPRLRTIDDPALLRIEDATLNASAPAEQQLTDGWLLRFCPGKAKRARSVQAIAAGAQPLDRKIADCERAYAAAALPCLFRITPMSQPAGLDAALEQAGFVAMEDSRQMVAPMPDAAALPDDDTALLTRPVGSDRFAEFVGTLRGSSTAAIAAHAARLRTAAWRVATSRLVAFDGDRPAACGQVIVEDGMAGLYDIIVADHLRGRGLGRWLTARLLKAAAEAGARIAYLQVDAENTAARALYARFGFVDRYAYWYRGRPEPLHSEPRRPAPPPAS